MTSRSTSGHPQEQAAPNTDEMDALLTDSSDTALVLAIARFRQEALAEAYRRHAPQHPPIVTGVVTI